MEASSATLTTPAKIISPAKTQAMTTKVGDPNTLAIEVTFLKTPDPIMALITIIIAIPSPKERSKPCVDFWGIEVGIFEISSVYSARKNSFGAYYRITVRNRVSLLFLKIKGTVPG